MIFKHCVVLFLSLSFYTPRLAKILLKRQLNRQVFFWHSTSWIKVRTWLYTKITLWPNERNCSKIFTTFHSKGVFGIFTQSFLCLLSLPRSGCMKITQNVVFELRHLPPIFVLLKLTCLVTLFGSRTHCLKSPKISHLSLTIMAFSINFCPNKNDLSGNNVWRF